MSFWVGRWSEPLICCRQSARGRFHPEREEGRRGDLAVREAHVPERRRKARWIASSPFGALGARIGCALANEHTGLSLRRRLADCGNPRRTLDGSPLRYAPRDGSRNGLITCHALRDKYLGETARLM